MKTIKNHFRIIALILAIFIAGSALANEPADTINYKSYKGKLIDQQTKKPLIFANVTLQNTNVATVTNMDGVFLIKVHKNETAKKIEFSYLGYKNATIDLNTLIKKNNIIPLKPAPISIEEVTVRPMDPKELVKAALAKTSINYSKDPNLMKAFYRETVKKRDHYVSISEAILDIYKAPYTQLFRSDLIKIYKGRKSADVKRMDTLLFKIQGGPNSTLLLDIVKNPHMILSQDYFNNYDYSYNGLININNKLNYVVEFKQNNTAEYPLYDGKLYIDVTSLAITRASFSLNLEDKKAAGNLFIRKKPLGLKLTPLNTQYLINYTEYNGKWYFNYARSEVKFRCNWKKRIFNTTYTTMTEMAITDRDDQNVNRFGSKTRMSSKSVFAEQVLYFMDNNFWGAYNTIEPDQAIEQAIKKLGNKANKR